MRKLFLLLCLILAWSALGQAQVTLNITLTFSDASERDQYIADFLASRALLPTIGSELSVTALTRSGATVTATAALHGLQAGDYVRINGAAQGQYNGVWRVASVPNANSFTYSISATLAPVTPATGTIKATKVNATQALLDFRAQIRQQIYDEIVGYRQRTAIEAERGRVRSEQGAVPE